MMIPKPEVTEVDVDGIVDGQGVRYLGTAKKQPDGAWVCLADVNGFLCKVEVKIRLGAGSYSTQL